MPEASKDSVRHPKRQNDGDGSVYCRHKKDCPERGKEKPKCKCPWQAAYVTGWRDGKPVRKKTSGKTRAQALAALRELKEKNGAGDLPSEGKAMSVEQWLTHWYKRILPRSGAKPYTIAGYNAKVNQYLIPLIGHHRLDKLTPEHIEDAYDTLRESGNPSRPRYDDDGNLVGLSPNTIHQTHRILSRALKVAVQRKRLRTNPAGADQMDAPAREETELDVMTEAQVDAILETCRGQWNAARWNVALALGLRQGEALGLRWEDVDLDAGILRVRQTLIRVTGQGIRFGTPKSKKSTRDLPIPASLLDNLRAHRKTQNEKRLELGNHWTDSGLVFTLEDGRPIDPSVDAGRWRRLLEQAGVRHYRLHDARHAAGTLMLAEGVDMRVAMAILGHSQISVTMRYQHAVDQMLVDAAQKLDRSGRWA